MERSISQEQNLVMGASVSEKRNLAVGVLISHAQNLAMGISISKEHSLEREVFIFLLHNSVRERSVSEKYNLEREMFIFYRAKFGKGGVHFSFARFGKGDVRFNGTEFGESNVFFNGVEFGGRALFRNLMKVDEIIGLSFRYADFNDPLDISSAENFPCLIDLTQTKTKTAHHVSLTEVNCILRREKRRKSFFFRDGDWSAQKVTEDKHDIARARRLKELAEANKDYGKAKDFHVIEMQVIRKHSACPVGYLWNPDFWYEKLGDYGRSIRRPLGWLAFIWLLWTEFYIMVNLVIEKNEIEWFKSLTYSTAQMFSFIPSSRSARLKMEEALFGVDYPEGIYVFTFSQSVLAIILLFLLGLALRHRYRI